MNKLFRSIFTVVLAVLLMVSVVGVPVAKAADRENSIVTNLTVLGKIIGTSLSYTTKAMAVANWTLTKAQSLVTFIQVTQSPSGYSIVVPTAFLRTGDLKVIRNAGGDSAAVTIKPYGGTGISVAAGKTAIVMYNGSDYVRVTADATH